MWKDYQNITKGSPPRRLLVQAVEHVKQGRALDLGSGAMNDSRFLVQKGFDVVAIDSTTPNDPPPFFLNTRFEDYAFPKNEFDLVNAQFSLPFIRPDAFERVWHDITTSLKPGGVFVGQLFGEKDSWNDGVKNITFHTLAQIKEMFTDLYILSLEEEQKPGVTASGDRKFWHIFHIIARKPR